MDSESRRNLKKLLLQGGLKGPPKPACPPNSDNLWIKSSLERVEHFREAKKFGQFISPPTTLAEAEKELRVAEVLLKEKVSELVESLEEGPPRSISPMRGIGDDVRRSTTLGWGTIGDPFFQKATPTTSSSTTPPPPTIKVDVDIKQEVGGGSSSNPRRRRKWTPSSYPPKVVNVKDFFPFPLSSSSSSSKNQGQKPPCASGRRRDVKPDRSRLGFDDMKQEAEYQYNPVYDSDNEDPLTQPTTDTSSFPSCPLKKFIDVSSGEPHRVEDVKFAMQDDTLKAYYQKRKDQRDIDYECKKSNLVDPLHEFIVELTAYETFEPDETTIIDGFVATVNSYKIEILGHQTLADLRDALMCENDFIYLKEMQHPDEPQDLSHLVKNTLRSAMLLIDHTIYDDMRQPTNFAYSSQIIEWSQSKPDKSVGPFKRGSLTDTKIEDLTIQFGFPYLFVHIGNCEHVIVFNRARLIHSEDEHRIEYYPRVKWSSDTHARLCKIDGEVLARWAVVDSEEFPDNPMLLCTGCLKGFCYTKDGSKKGSFRLFPFRQLVCELPLPSERASGRTS